jgi:hypothetical protein
MPWYARAVLVRRCNRSDCPLPLILLLSHKFLLRRLLKSKEPRVPRSQTTKELIARRFQKSGGLMRMLKAMLPSSAQRALNPSDSAQPSPNGCISLLSPAVDDLFQVLLFVDAAFDTDGLDTNDAGTSAVAPYFCIQCRRRVCRDR